MTAVTRKRSIYNDGHYCSLHLQRVVAYLRGVKVA